MNDKRAEDILERCLDKSNWYKAVYYILMWVAVGVTVVMLASCTPTSRQWRSNTSLDVGYGGETKDVREGYGYLGASYYFDYGVSASLGIWNTPDLLYWGPYYGINYSWVPFE